MKDVLAVLGGVMMAATAVVGTWLAVKKWRSSQKDKEVEDDKEINTKFATLEASLITLAASKEANETQYNQFRERITDQLQELSQHLDNLKTQAQQHANDLGGHQKELERLSEHYDRLARELQQHKEYVAEKFLTTANYQHDLQMWTTNINGLQDTIKDLAAMLGRGM